ncbi:MAG: zinc ribbon domain-containing protein [Holophagales bacterium]|jgi:putative FmdB family regulatory protein|nr:MAG: zinc ribbon domain-containing protein [Holophagales bacterium]
MPIYEYQCESCGERSELIQRFDDPPATLCPRCGGSLRKLLSAPSFQFKGSGWYVTDYAGKNAGNRPSGEGAEKKESAAAESKGESSAATPASESKSESSAPKSDTKPAS